MVDEQAHLRAELRAEERRRKWRAPKHTPERQCTATTRQGKGERCKAPRCKRPDGTLAPTCRMHGGAPFKSLESQARALENLLRFREAGVRALRTKLASIYEAIAHERIMGVRPSDTDVSVSLPASPGSELNSPQDSAANPHDKDGR